LIKTVLGGKLVLVPIQPNPQRILDLGTGIGLWAIEMGENLFSHDFISPLPLSMSMFYLLSQFLLLH
jgi:ubiquinone/menaquinone biosynthesis C-methylase UbiE